MTSDQETAVTQFHQGYNWVLRQLSYGITPETIKICHQGDKWQAERRGEVASFDEGGLAALECVEIMEGRQPKAPKLDPHSNCCGWFMGSWPESDLCPKCKEHCDVEYY